MLVDPFKDPREVWTSVGAVVQALNHEQLLGAIELFAHGRQLVTWSAPPNGFLGPIAKMVALPYQLALYATEPFKAQAQLAAEALGWTCTAQ
ncbi:MAG: hypothetical protein AAF495_00420 [Pseudomonadota bacterium]